MKEVVGISFENGRIYYFDPNGHKIKENITVIVETEQGQQFGTVKIPLLKIDENKIKNPLKKIIRVSTKRDYMQYKKNQKEATLAKEKCQEISDKLKLNMKILDASYTFDRDKLLFRFLSDTRVDFRDLAKELAKIYKVRIELRQIGVRDKAKEVDGLGPCGRRLCCASFLKDLDTVSINMAKNQNISINKNVNTTASMSRLRMLSHSNWQKIGETDSGAETIPLNSVIPIRIPIAVVARIPRSIAPRTFNTYSNPVITNPMIANNAGPEVISPNATNVASEFTMICPFCIPINAINNPIPPPIA